MKFPNTLLCFACIVASLGAAERRPNFLLILSDDHGWSQVSQTMHPDIPEAQSSYLRTPNLDRMGREGLRFSSGYSPAPLCTPTRRSILCGTTAARSGSEFASRWKPTEHMTMPKALKQADASYRAAHFGKWGEQMNATPEEVGYDASDGLTGNNTGGMPGTLNSKSPESGNVSTKAKSKAGKANHNNTAPFYTNQPDPKLTGHVTDRTIAFMREAAREGKPFYVQASYYAVHLSIVCREETLKRVEARGAPDRQYTPAFAAMLEEMDEGVGRLLDALRELSLNDNTFVVFTADNGGRPTLPGYDPSRLPGNHPLTGGKHELYEGGIRVPFVVKGPGIPRGSVSNVPVSSYDLLPTFYDLAGGRTALPAEVDGVSLKGLWQNPKGPAPTRAAVGLIFHRPMRGVSVIRQGEYKLLLNWDKNGAVGSRELYRFAPDPREKGRDLAQQEPDRVRKLEAALLAYLKTAKAETASSVPQSGKGENDL